MALIPFNKPHMTGKETQYIHDAVYVNGHISGNGQFTQKCHSFFENKYQFKKTLLTTSCTDALEMTAILLEIQPGDEVIVPSYTFVSTALAFVRQGAKIVFADSRHDHPGMDEDEIEKLITPRTKAIVVVHYAGVACDMDKIMSIASQNNIKVVEDAAQAVDAYYKEKPLGSIGHFGTFSFHETKNIQSGEGGLLVINDEKYFKRAEIIWEKGTNRAEFFRGEINKYGWVDTGSSFLPSELTAAFLFAQLESLETIQVKRKKIWDMYDEKLKPLADEGYIRLPFKPGFATNNGHIFYITCSSATERKDLIDYMKRHDVLTVFHYLSLHQSKYIRDKQGIKQTLPMADHYQDHLLRLPLFYDLTPEQVNIICQNIIHFYKS